MTLGKAEVTGNQPAKGLAGAASIFDRSSASLIERVNLISSFFLLLIAVFTFVGVVARYVFKAPIPGFDELTAMLMVIIVFLGAAAYAQVRKRHISIDLLLGYMPTKGQLVLNGITCLLSIGLFLVITWRTFLNAMYFANMGAHTPSLQIPTAPVRMIISFGVLLLVLALSRDFVNYLADGRRLGLGKAQWVTMFAVPLVVLVLIALLLRTEVTISALMVGTIGIVLMILIFFTGMPVAFVMITVGFLGLAYQRGVEGAFAYFGNAPWTTTADYNFSVLPLFVTMGFLIVASGIGTDLYRAAYAWLARVAGGLAVATIAACTLYAAVVGDVMTGTIAIGSTALPEMKKHGYDDRLNTGVILAGSTLGSLIPPSVPFMIYGVITSTSIGALFMAGVFPGLLWAVAWTVQVYVQCRLNPKLGPRGPSTTWAEKGKALRNIWTVVILFVLVLGGIYLGIFTPTEAGGIGVVGSILIGLALKRFTKKSFVDALTNACSLAGMLFIMLTGASLITTFFVVSKFPAALSAFLVGLNLSPIAIVGAIFVLFLILGCFLNAFAMMVAIIPIVYPVIKAMGIDPLWFGVLIVMSCNIGALTPPFAGNVFALKAVHREIPIGTMFRGVMPFVCVATACSVLIMFVPEIATWLPSRMKY